MFRKIMKQKLYSLLRVMAVSALGFLCTLSYFAVSPKSALAAPGSPKSITCSASLHETADGYNYYDLTLNWEYESHPNPTGGYSGSSYGHVAYYTYSMGNGMIDGTRTGTAQGYAWVYVPFPQTITAVLVSDITGEYLETNCTGGIVQTGGGPVSISCSVIGGPHPAGQYFDNWDVSYSYEFQTASPPPAQWYGVVELTGYGGGSSNSVGMAGNGVFSLGGQKGQGVTFTVKLTSWITNTAITNTCSASQPQPLVTIGASPSTVSYGGTTTISWSSQNADSCTATAGAGFSTGGATSGSDASSALTSDESFTVTCTGAGGTASDSVTVAVTLPPLSCSLSDYSIVVGGGLTATASGGVGSYSWTTPGANASGSGANLNLQYLSPGSYSVDVATTTSGQTAHCGDVTVNPSGPYANLWVVGSNPVNYNSAATLGWEGGGGDINTCVATQGPGFSTGGAVNGTDQSSALTTTTQFTVVCTGPTSTASDSRTVYVNGAAPACGAPYPQAAYTSNTSGTFYAYVEGVTGAGQVLFPTWGDPGGQDDIVWYQGVNLGGGTWRAAINLAAHKNGNPEYGNINVHVYARSSSYPSIADTFCGAANFTRTNSPVPVVTLGVSPSSGTYPQVATLTWTTTNSPTSCVASSSTNDWTGSKGTNATNTDTLVPAVGAHTYTITCSNASGVGSDSASYTQNACVGCSPSGTISISPASPCSITPPATSCNPTPMVSWSTTNVTNAQLLVSKKDPNTGVFGPYTLFNSGCSPNNPSGLPRSITASGNVVDEYSFKLYSGPDCFTFPGGGMTGTVVLLWDDTNGAVPTGWTCVSCTIGDPFYGRFPRATDTYGGTGGADAHTHTLTYQSETDGASRAIGESASGGSYPSNTHQHTWSPVTTASGSTLPQYKQLKFISRTNPPSIPAGSIAIFDTTVPSGWSRYTALDGVYLRGGPDNSVGGAATHTHTFTTTSATAGGTVRNTANNTQVASSHSHTITNASLVSAANTPPYIDVIFGQATADTAAPAGMIAFFTGAAPSGWTTVSGVGSSYYQRLLRGSSTFGGTGGSSTHDHGGSVTATTGLPSGNNYLKSGFSNIGSELAHTHAVTFVVDTQSSMPGYRDVVLAKYSAFTLLDTKTLTGSLPAPYADLGLSNKDVISLNGKSVGYTPTDGIAEADVGSTTIAEGTPIGFGIHIVNSGTAAVTGQVTVVDSLTNLAPPTKVWDVGDVALVCNGGACNKGTQVQSVSYSAQTKRVTFVLAVAAGDLDQNDWVSIRYTAYPQGPTGTTASIFRFTNEAAITYTDPMSGVADTVDCTGLALSCPLRIPLVLFYRGLPVPFLKEIQ